MNKQTKTAGILLGQKLLHVVLLSGFVFAQPLLDLIGNNTEFLVASKAGSYEVYVLLATLCLGIPVVIASIELLARMFGQKISNVVHLCLIFILCSCLYVTSLNLLTELPGAYLLISAILAGLITCYFYWKFSIVRTYLNFLSPAILIIPIYFLLNPQIAKLTGGAGKDINSSGTNISSFTPIVMLIFDEFPVLSLLDENGRIDRVRYPNFAVLADDAVWFRNTQTVSGETLDSVPAMLSGKRPVDGLLPIQSDYPHTLFTLFENSHKLEVFETVTSLCPDLSCGGDIIGPAIESQKPSLEDFLRDVSVVYLHLLIPEDYADQLPVISQTWKGFAQQASQAGSEGQRRSYTAVSRPEGFKNFLDKMTDSEKPGFYFYHTIFPHVPWRFLPSGNAYKRYNIIDIPGLDLLKEQWGDNDWLVTQGQQRHLLQVGYADSLVGDLVKKLKKENIYEKTLIIVTSDHGVSFWPNSSRRARGYTRPGTERDVLGIPLFMKMPNQRSGQLNDEPVQSIDIVPTIGHTLGIEIPWKTDGRVIPATASVKADSSSRDHPYTDNVSLVRKLGIFGSGTSHPDGLFHIGAHRELIGHHVADTEIQQQGEMSVFIDQRENLAVVDINDSYLPAYLTGEIVNTGDRHDALALVIAVNGVITAVTTSFWTKDKHRFSAMLPESSLAEGNNRVSVYQIAGSEAKPVLSELKIVNSPSSR